MPGANRRSKEIDHGCRLTDAAWSHEHRRCLNGQRNEPGLQGGAAIQPGMGCTGRPAGYFTMISRMFRLGAQLMQPFSFFSSLVCPQRSMVFASRSMDSPGLIFSSYCWS